MRSLRNEVPPTTHATRQSTTGHVTGTTRLPIGAKRGDAHDSQFLSICCEEVGNGGCRNVVVSIGGARRHGYEVSSGSGIDDDIPRGQDLYILAY